MDTIRALLGEGLPEEMMDTLQEAFEKKVAEARDEAEMSIREEFAARYEHDKATLVDAMNHMLTRVVKENEVKKTAQINKLKESKKNLDKTLVETKNLYKSKLKEHVNVSQTFVVEQLTKQIKSLSEEKQALAAKQKKLDEAFEKVKADLKTETASRFKKIDEFVVRQVTKELSEFEQDHRALVEKRVQLVKENKQKLRETQNRFIKEAAAKVEKTINEHVKKEMSQLHEDLEKNRQNMFGRRIFEAVAAEYMTSYLAEGTEIRKLQSVLESAKKELAITKSKLDETVKATEVAGRKVKLAEDRSARTKVMSELLSNLRGEKRSIMESMLETTKTEHLRTAFDRLLPVVLNETKRTAPVEKVLTEKPAPRHMASVTGNRENRLFESMKAESDAEIENNTEINTIVRLAGLQGK